jgi:hypothetical protein
LTATKFKPLIFSMCGFASSSAANMFILMILYGFCLPPAQFCYIIIYIWKAENRVQITDRCVPWKILIVRITSFCRRCNFKRQVSAANSQAGQA